MTEQIYIDGAWRQPTTGETIPVYCPSDGREFARSGRGNAADVDAAVAAARYFEFYGAAADKLHGDVVPFLEGYTVLVTREPRGVTGHIIPWNYPAQMFGRSLG